MKFVLLTFFICTPLFSNLLHGQDNPTAFYLKDTLPESVAVASNPYVIINGHWKYHPDDNSLPLELWTSLDFNDTTWENVLSRLPLDSLPKNGWPGAGLFRLHLIADSLLWNKPLAINVIQKGASEIYLDGNLVLKRGVVGQSSSTETGINTLTISPEFIVLSQANHILSIRFSSFRMLHDRPPSIKELGFAVIIGNAATATLQNLNNLKFFKTIEVLTIAIPLTFSILHFLLFLFAGKIRSNLYFAVFTFIIALWGLLEHESYFAQNLNMALTLKRLWPVYIALAPLTGLRFLYSLFYPKIPRQFWVYTVVGCLLSVAIWFTHRLVQVLILTLFVLYIVEILRVVLVAIKQKRQGANIIGIGFMTFGLSLLVLIIAVLVFNYFSVYFFYGMLYLVGILGILVSMSLYLSRSISMTNKNLEAQTKKSMSLELENARKEVELEKAAELKEAYNALEVAHSTLKSTQAQLIQSEKMASLGELTAGIAHEIQNPLNFINNFSEVNTELIDEMNHEIDKGNLPEVKSIAKDIKENQIKITDHGKRADAIVKGMLQHSRSSSGVKEPTDINALADEYLRLAYHGLRAKDKSFNATMKTDYDPSIGLVNVIPQDIGRVILNLITNAFYAVSEKGKTASTEYEPTVIVRTQKLVPPIGGKGGEDIEISVSDNGPGIPASALDKIFQPFFTTKPTGQGTGLGLSLSYDIVKAHGGEIKVSTKEGKGTEFIIQLPAA